VHGGSLTVPAGKTATVTGDITTGDLNATLQPDGTLTIAGRISSTPTALDWVQRGAGTVILSNPENTFFAPGAIPASIALTLSDADKGGPAILDLNGIDVTLSSLAGRRGGAVQLGANTLTLNMPNGIVFPPFFLGTIAGSGNLVKDGEGLIALAGNQANTFTGTTTVKAGVLNLIKTAGNAIVGPLAISGGQLFVGVSNQSALHGRAAGVGVVEQQDLAGVRLEDGRMQDRIRISGPNAALTKSVPVIVTLTPFVPREKMFQLLFPGAFSIVTSVRTRPSISSTLVALRAVLGNFRATGWSFTGTPPPQSVQFSLALQWLLAAPPPPVHSQANATSAHASSADAIIATRTVESVARIVKPRMAAWMGRVPARDGEPVTLMRLAAAISFTAATH
jgi:autotransporter-associated beta strand protein